MFASVIHYVMSVLLFLHLCHVFVFFNDTAATEIYTLSLHDALPIFMTDQVQQLQAYIEELEDELADSSQGLVAITLELDRKSTRLNSSHITTSYAVFCLKKKIAPSSRIGILAAKISTTIANKSNMKRRKR